MRILPAALASLFYFLAISSSLLAQPGSETPEPAPTNAVQILDKRLTVEGVGKIPLGDPIAAQKNAYQAAVLDAYHQLFWQGAQAQGLLPETPPLDSRTFRLDEQHPNPVLLDWLLRAEVVSQQEVGGRLRVNVQSPPVGELAKDNVQILRSQSFDVDNDKELETIMVTYDGRIMVSKQGKILAVSPCLNVFSCSTMRSLGSEPWEQVQLTRLLNVGGLEAVGKDKLRVVADLSLGESVDEFWVGKASEQREVLLRWDDPKNEPKVQITEPHDFAYTLKDKVAWKGTLLTPSGLLNAKLRVNGRPFWQTPERLNTQRLRMDILLPLLPGVNRAQVQVNDLNHRTLSREVLLFREAACPPVVPARRRALVVGVDEYAASQFPKLPGVSGDLKRLADFLRRPDQGAFAPEQVVVLSGKEATRAKILEQLKALTRVEGEERVTVLVYFAGLSAPSGGSGGKGLLPYDAKGFDEGALSPRDLLEAVGEIKQQDILLVADTSQTRLHNNASNQLWLDSQEFAESLSRQGWAVLSSVDGQPEQRDVTAGSRMLSAFLEGCSGAADSNHDGSVEWDESYRYLFQALRVSSPSTSSPLRRGELIGRVPISICKKP